MVTPPPTFPSLSLAQIFKQNSFEQLCINYANEHLQRLFNQTVFDEEMALYESEGIGDTVSLDYLDNEPVLSLIGGRRTGLLALLQREDLAVEVALQLLVGVVDAQLLEAVALEDLEAKNLRERRPRAHQLACAVCGDERRAARAHVENSKMKGAFAFAPQRLVDFDYKPIKKPAVERLGERVARIGGFLLAQRDLDDGTAVAPGAHGLHA